MSTQDTMLTYTEGDATAATDTAPRIIAHVCNDAGLWGSGFVLAVSARWEKAELKYRDWARGQLRTRDGSRVPFGLGMIQLVRVEPHIWVANMVAQRDIWRAPGDKPIRYDALDTALTKLGSSALKLGASVHMPRIGAGRARGDWSRIEMLIEQRLCAIGVPVTVYDWSPSRSQVRRARTNSRSRSGR